MEMEEWKMIPGYEGLYMVSNFGRVKSLNYLHTGKERLMKPSVYNDGYLRVKLTKNKVRKPYLVHRLVAMAFIPNPDNLPQVNHKDENGLNNHVDNLEWCNAKYNVNYGTRIERISKPVYQYSIDGKLIKEWPSTRDVERELGFSNGNICKCCNGKIKSAYGFIWRYA